MIGHHFHLRGEAVRRVRGPAQRPQPLPRGLDLRRCPGFKFSDRLDGSIVPVQQVAARAPALTARAQEGVVSDARDQRVLSGASASSSRIDAVTARVRPRAAAAAGGQSS